jgi:hypothetical protein
VGEEPDRVSAAGRDPSAEDVKRLEKDIEASRERLSDVVAELDRRRHALLSPGTYPLRFAAVAAGATLLAGGAVFVVLRARRRRRRFAKRSRQLADAFTRMVRHPERVASDAKSPLSRIAVAVVPILIRKIADGVLRRR